MLDWFVRLWWLFHWLLLFCASTYRCTMTMSLSSKAFNVNFYVSRLIYITEAWYPGVHPAKMKPVNSLACNDRVILCQCRKSTTKPFLKGIYLAIQSITNPSSSFNDMASYLSAFIQAFRFLVKRSQYFSQICTETRFKSALYTLRKRRIYFPIQL